MSYEIVEETDSQIVVIADGVRITRKKQPPRDFLDQEADSIIAQARHERSKREDSQEYPIPGCPGFVYRETNPQTMNPVMRAKYEKAKEICEMRCSEQSGNRLREVQ